MGIKNKMEETSAGAVIFRELPTGRVFLLLHYPSGHWDFVKGKIEPGEKPLQTVIREAKEETGINDLVFVDGYEKIIQYNFQFEGNPIHKKVIFYLANTNKENITISHEHIDFVWLEFEKAMKKITFENAKKILLEANSHLAKTL